MNNKIAVIKIQGGLGNQMLQFAFYVSLSYKGYDASIDLSYYSHYVSHNGYELDRIFGGLTYKLVTDDVRDDLSDIKRDFMSRLRRKFFPKKTHYIEKNYSYDFNHEKIVAVLSKSNLYLDGYWSDLRYFDSVQETIREIFTFPKFNDSKNINLFDKISNSLSVSIHIRRGDKVNSNFHRIHSLDYYLPAINILKNLLNYESIKFFVFSDDIDWTKENFKSIDADFKYVSWNKGENSFRDMQLMSLCKHNINAASSFSWWAAYLNKNPNKIVITPKNMLSDAYHHLEDTGLIPSDWIQI